MWPFRKSTEPDLPTWETIDRAPALMIKATWQAKLGTSVHARDSVYWAPTVQTVNRARPWVEYWLRQLKTPRYRAESWDCEDVATAALILLRVAFVRANHRPAAALPAAVVALTRERIGGHAVLAIQTGALQLSWLDPQTWDWFTPSPAEIASITQEVHV